MFQSQCPKTSARFLPPAVRGWCPALLALLACACEGALPATPDEAPPDVSSAALASAAHAWGFSWVVPGGAISSGYSYNSGGGTNSVTGSGGLYTVTMPELGLGGGNVQVVGYGSGPNRCKVRGWSPSGSNAIINVACHAPSGVLADSPFVVLFNVGALGQEGAYLWYSGSDIPSAYSWNSEGLANTFESLGVGLTAVTLGGLNFVNAGIQVTAYGSNPAYCAVVSHGPVATGIRVVVRCNDAAGSPTASAFSLAYSDGAPRSGMIGGHARVDGPTLAPPAYANIQPAIGSRIPAAASVAGHTQVQFPDTAGGPFVSTAALATAYGAGSTYCKVSSWSPSGTGFAVFHGCFTAAGTLVPANFISSFVRAAFPSP